MRRLSRLLLFLSCVVILAPTVAGQASSGKSKSKKPSISLNQKIYDNLWAVVIGVNQYKNWDRLEYAVNDARGVKKMLIDQFGFKPGHILELLNEEATLLNIRTVLGGVLPQKAGKNDGVLIFFAGHGETVDLPEGGNLGYLVPVDGSSEKSEYFATLLPMTQIREICNLIPAKHIFFVVDACYSGLAAASERGMSTDVKLYIRKLAALRSRQILTAGGKGEPVVERAEWGHSAFTYKFLEGLGKGMADVDDDGVITATEIATYIKTRVPKISDNKQTPQFKNLTNDEGEFIFLRPDAFTKKEEPAEKEEVDTDTEFMKKELDRIKRENEALRKKQEEMNKKQTETKKEEKKTDEIFTPPP